jgi:hypothetical protein
MKRKNKILGLLASYGIKHKDLAVYIGKTPRTVSKRMEDPGTFTLGELQAFRMRTRISKEEIMEAIESYL